MASTTTDKAAIKREMDYLESFERQFIDPLSEQVRTARDAAQDALRQVSEIRSELTKRKLALLESVASRNSEEKV